jgi:lipopolysaccharide transport protein LptA
MLKHWLIGKNSLLLILVFLLFSFQANAAEEEKKTKGPIEIISDSMTADQKRNIIIFIGSVVATTTDLKINSNKMEVTYNQDQKIDKIYATGNVKVKYKEIDIESNEATQYANEDKIVFVGNVKAVDGENVLTGDTMVYNTKTELLEVKGRTKVFIKDKQDKEKPGSEKK